MLFIFLSIFISLILPIHLLIHSFSLYTLLLFPFSSPLLSWYLSFNCIIYPLSRLLYLFCYRIYHYLFALYILFLYLYYSISSPFNSDTYFLTLLFLLSQYAIPSLYLASFTASTRFVDSPMFVHGSIEGKWSFLNLPLLTMKLCSPC